jgi:hypothetical protein
VAYPGLPLIGNGDLERAPDHTPGLDLDRFRAEDEVEEYDEPRKDQQEDEPEPAAARAGVRRSISRLAGAARFGALL